MITEKAVARSISEYHARKTENIVPVLKDMIDAAGDEVPAKKLPDFLVEDADDMVVRKGKFKSTKKRRRKKKVKVKSTD